MRSMVEGGGRIRNDCSSGGIRIMKDTRRGNVKDAQAVLAQEAVAQIITRRPIPA